MNTLESELASKIYFMYVNFLVNISLSLVIKFEEGLCYLLFKGYTKKKKKQAAQDTF